MNAAGFQLRVCKILQRNFAECVNSAQRTEDPSTRPRYDETAEPSPAEPLVSDLGEYTSDLSFTMMSWSNQLHDFGIILKEDKVSIYRRAL